MGRAESLASRGFVVAVAPLNGPFDTEYVASLRGLEANARDIAFVAAEASRLPFADGRRVSLMGVGIVANAAVLAAMSNPDIDAVISLEGGLPSPSEDSLMKRSLAFDVTALRQPMLLITAPFDARNLALLDQYRYSDRLRVEFPGMREFHFLSWGMLERLVPNVLGPPPGDTQTGFEWGARWVAAFLGGARSVEGAPEGMFERIDMPAAAPVPSFVEAKRIIREQGIDGLGAQPWPVETLADLYYHFAFRGGDNDFTRRLGILRIWTESHPHSARAAIIYAQMLRTAKQEEADAHGPRGDQDR